MADEKTAVESVPENTSLVSRIRAIEKRWGKEFMEVMADIHDHLFGATPVEPEPTSQRVSETKDGG